VDYGQGLANVPSGTALFIQSFENAIGNIHHPKYTVMKHHDDVNLSVFWEGVQVLMIWTTWFLNQYTILVIMLNFLIAVINDTYVEEQNVEKMRTYQYRNELNIEYLLIRNFFLKAKTITCVLYATDKELYKVDSQEMEDFSDEIKKTIEKSNEETREKVDQSLQAVSDINERMTSLETLMKDMKSMMEKKAD
jgi:hypothetical protein